MSAGARSGTLEEGQVRAMFDRIAGPYDLMNSVMTAGLHHRWRERAADLFAHYRLWDTEDNCGILVYIDLADRKVEIIADRGVAPVLSQDEWRALCGNMTAGFARGAYEASALAAVTELNSLLHARYPRRGPARNELGNQPVVL